MVATRGALGLNLTSVADGALELNFRSESEKSRAPIVVRMKIDLKGATDGQHFRRP